MSWTLFLQIVVLIFIGWLAIVTIIFAIGEQKK